MRELKRVELISLRTALMDVREFIQRTEKQKTAYYYVQFDNMINNIELFFYSGDTDTRLISEILLRDWGNANDELIGIPACELMWIKKPEHKEEIYQLWELIAAVEIYFPEEEEDDDFFYEINENW